MRIYKATNYDDMSRKAAHMIFSQVSLKPACVLGLATGSSPLGLYQQLIEWYKKGDIDFSQVTSVNLDEYRGLAPNDSQSYRYFMNKNFFEQVNIKADNTHVPNGLAENPEQECARYEQLIQSLGGVDMQLLGLGTNGHIGFNEPDAAFAPATHCVSLAESTIEANKRFFDKAEDVPRQAYTMGIGSIMRARRIVVIASGSAKADAVRAALFGPITPQVPASVLQLHQDVTLIGDAEALACI